MRAIMAKKKQSKPAEADRKKRWAVALPMIYRDQIAKLTETTRRDLNEEVAIALEKHLKEAGLWPPSEDETEENA